MARVSFLDFPSFPTKFSLPKGTNITHKVNKSKKTCTSKVQKWKQINNKLILHQIWWTSKQSRVKGLKVTKVTKVKYSFLYHF